jgi:glycerol-3-phosphate dehydrogenase
MTRRVDVLVVGGGIQGATTALEVARRGLSVLLVERDDFGAGASSSSQRVAHGGLRYLQSLDLPRCLESIRERRRWLRAAPGLVRPLAVRLDASGRSALYRAALHAGLRVNDLLALGRNRGVAPAARLPRSRFPVWYDARFEDTERLLLAVLGAALRAGDGQVEVRNHAPLLGWRTRAGRIVGAQVAGVGEVEAGCVLRCTGPARPGERPLLAMNLVVDAVPLCADGCAVGFAHPDEDRNLFAVPWRGRTILGVFQRDYSFDAAAPFRFEAAWVDECLAWLRAAHPELARLSRRDVRLVHAGLLPRARPDRLDPAERARVEAAADGAIDVQGVKWTTAWAVAERAADLALRQLGRAPRAPAPCPPLGEAAEGKGSMAPGAAGSPGEELLLPGRSPLARRAVERALDAEWARTLRDVLLRRTGTASVGHPGEALVEAVADLAQRRLGWSERERKDEIEAFHADWRFAGQVRRE